MSYSCVQADCIDWLWSLPANSVDLVFGSPPYEKARTYGIGFNLRGQAWVDWMVEVYRAASDACRGLVAFVVAGQTNKFRWSGTPALLMADLHRRGFCLRHPPIFHRIGIPGSGGPDWLRCDTEFIVCVTPPGRLLWSCNTAMGHPPKWAPGGAMSHRLTSGARRNQWGSNGSTQGGRGDKLRQVQGKYRPSHIVTTPAESYKPPVLANPGNVIHCKVGGSLMGSKLAHENEAPFPEALAEFFIRSFCQPGGVVCDPFAGSGTTLAVAVKHGRNAIGCDIRQSQVDLTLRRCAIASAVKEAIGG